MTEVADRPADAGAGDDIAERDRRIEGLRAKYRSLQEIDERQRNILDELSAIDAIDDPDGGDFIWQGSLIREHDDLEHMAQKPRKRAADLDRVRAAHEVVANREEATPRTPDLQTRNTAGKDPFRDMERVSRGLVEPMEVRGRAQDAIEFYSSRGDLAHDFAENANQLAQEQFFGPSNVARHILETGTPDYYDAFRAYLSDPGKYSARAALTLTSANGGYLLPFVLDPTIILTNAGSANPWRRISNIKQTTSSTWNGVNSAGVNAAWLAEATIVTDGSPTVGNVVVTPSKAAAWVYGQGERELARAA